MINMKDEKIFTTSDIWLAATLVTLGYMVVGVNHDNPTRIGFNFDNDVELQKNIAKYMSDSLLLQPQRLRDSFKYVKSLLYGD